MKKGIFIFVFFSFAIIAGWCGVQSALAAGTDTIVPCTQNALSAEYYRIPTVTGDVANLDPSSQKLLTEENLVLKGTDSLALFDLPQIDQRRFPDFDKLPGNPRYFAAHWRGSVTVPKDGMYRVTLSSHEASQLFINGSEIISIKPNNAFGGRSQSILLTAGTTTVDIYFAKRSDYRSGLNFKLEGASFTSCATNANTVVIGSTVSNNATSTVASTVVATSSNVSNIAPRVVFFDPPKTAEADKYFAYKVLALDAEQKALSYKLAEAPQGMSIAPLTGLLLWKPTLSQVSTKPYSVAVQVTDGIDTTTSRFEISVKIPVTNSALSQKNTSNNQVSGSVTGRKAVSASDKNISISDESRKETSAPAGSRMLASVLFTGVFNIGHWAYARLKFVLYFILGMMLLGVAIFFVLEVLDRIKRRKNIANPAVVRNNIQPARPMATQFENA